MGLLDWLTPPATVPFSEPDEPVAVAGDPAPLTLAGMTRAQQVATSLALSIPSVRRAQHVIAGTIGTFALYAWAGRVRLDPADPRGAWLAQPEARRTRQRTITRTVQDLIWRDRSVWRPLDRTLLGATLLIERVHPARIETIPHPLDPETVQTWIIDGVETPESRLVIFDGAGLGGLNRFGFDILTIYGQLQAAAGRYARAPHPYAILKNHGADLTKEEILELLDDWEAARETRGIGYTNDVIDYEPLDGSWSARDLQLTEAREHAATEVARLFGLPAWTLDAKSGDAMTYSNIVDRRRDLLEALRPWMSILEQTISLDDRAGRTSGVLLPRGVTAVFDSDAYVRDDPEVRMRTWAAGLASGVLDLDDAQTAEPLARK